MDARRRVPPDAEEGAPPVRFVSVGEEFELQEALLRRGEATVRVGILRDRGLSFGVGVHPQAAYLLRARALGVRTFPRGTGGTGVLHLQDDLVWAVVLPRSDPRVGRDFSRAYGRLGSAVVTGLSAFGLRGQWVGAPGLVEDYCPLSSRGEVLVAGGKVLGGAAQHVTSSALLHHGSVSWNIDRPEVDRLFDLPPGGPSQRLGGVAELGGVPDPTALAEAVAAALLERFGV